MKELTNTLKKFHSFECTVSFNPIDDIRNSIKTLLDMNYNFTVNISKILEKLDLIDFEIRKDKTLGLCHNDLNPSNILYCENKVYLIDFEFSAMGDIFFDLAMFSWLLDESSRNDLLENYFGYNSDKLRYKLKNYIFIAKLWNALWSLKKSLTSNVSTNYDYALGANIILNELLD